VTHIICRAMTCLFWEGGVCTSEEIEYEPDVGCLTFQDLSELDVEDEEEEDLGWEDSTDEDLGEEEDEEWEEDSDWDDEDDLGL